MLQIADVNVAGGFDVVDNLSSDGIRSTGADFHVRHDEQVQSPLLAERQHSRRRDSSVKRTDV